MGLHGALSLGGWKSPGKFPDLCLLCSLKLGWQSTRHRLHAALLLPTPLPFSPHLLHCWPPPLSPSCCCSLCQFFAAAFVAVELPPLLLLSYYHRAIASNTAVVKLLLPPSSQHRRHQAIVPVELPTDAMVYHLPGGIICLDSSGSYIGSDVEKILKWDNCLQKTKTFSTAYQILVGRKYGSPLLNELQKLLLNFVDQPAGDYCRQNGSVDGHNGRKGPKEGTGRILECVFERVFTGDKEDCGKSTGTACTQRSCLHVCR